MTSCLNLPPSAEHKVHQSIGVIGQAKCCIGPCTGTLLHLDNCHFAVWMPHTTVCDRRSPHRPSTPASKFGHTHSIMAFMDKGAQVQPEVATYAFPPDASRGRMSNKHIWTTATWMLHAAPDRRWLYRESRTSKTTSRKHGCIPSVRPQTAPQAVKAVRKATG